MENIKPFQGQNYFRYEKIQRIYVKNNFLENPKSVFTFDILK